MPVFIGEHKKKKKKKKTDIWKEMWLLDDGIYTRREPIKGRRNRRSAATQEGERARQGKTNFRLLGHEEDSRQGLWSDMKGEMIHNFAATLQQKVRH